MGHFKDMNRVASISDSYVRQCLAPKHPLLLAAAVHCVMVSLSVLFDLGDLLGVAMSTATGSSHWLPVLLTLFVYSE